MIPDKLEQESKKLKDIITDAINNFRYETNLVPMIEIKITESTHICSIVTNTEVIVKVQL